MTTAPSDRSTFDDMLCPYCGYQFAMLGPFYRDIRDMPFVVDKVTPVDKLCLPYTRDIGKFDPDPQDDQAHGEWSRVGTDFFGTILGWERFGVLRVREDAHECITVLHDVLSVRIYLTCLPITLMGSISG